MYAQLSREVSQARTRLATVISQIPRHQELTNLMADIQALDSVTREVLEVAKLIRLDLVKRIGPSFQDEPLSNQTDIILRNTFHACFAFSCGFPVILCAAGPNVHQNASNLAAANYRLLRDCHIAMQKLK